MEEDALESYRCSLICHDQLLLILEILLDFEQGRSILQIMIRFELLWLIFRPC
jgi:hypothetical protein